MSKNKKPVVNAMELNSKLSLTIAVTRTLKYCGMIKERTEFIRYADECQDMEELTELACGYVELQIA